MYRKRGVDTVLEEVVAKLRNPSYKQRHKPVTYAASDVAKAKVVLDRLLAATARSEISSISTAVEENNE